jgi:hypothetical protein
MASRMDLRVDSFYYVVGYKNLQGGIKISLKASYRHLQRNPFHNSLLKITIIVYMYGLFKINVPHID